MQISLLLIFDAYTQRNKGANLKKRKTIKRERPQRFLFSVIRYIRVSHMFSFAIEEYMIFPIIFHMLLNNSKESSDSKTL